MLSILVLTILLNIISRSITQRRRYVTLQALIEYTSTIMDESLTVFYNPIFSLEISESSNNSAVYLKIAKQILKADELCFDIMVDRFDGVKFLIPNDPILLCELLEEEVTNQNSILSKLRFSRVFNVEGLHCPIPAGKKKLMPYMPPSHIILDNDIGCGEFNFKITIKSCNKEKLQNYAPMISAETIINLQAEHCSNILI
ncbi:uncharacterized protein LOC115232763 isoform X1 [Formica exsecta]|uniref:uncharacterized protein LOC115232763 isoform X1 n=1 Tax=Formica exsecta TaxID=72781 RepID=UPI001143413F|nr:uncharacterized protein LOC115232763 isoform X1 [Formica exsecta]